MTFYRRPPLTLMLHRGELVNANRYANQVGRFDIEASRYNLVGVTPSRKSRGMVLREYSGHVAQSSRSREPSRDTIRVEVLLMAHHPSPAIPLIVGTGLVAFLFAAASGERKRAARDTPEGRWQDYVQRRLGEALEWPYWYGGGGPHAPWRAGTPVDCSGFATMALERIGLVPANNIIRYRWVNTPELGQPIPKGQQRPGDLVCFTGHIEVVWAYPDRTGDSPTIGARGGLRDDYGNRAQGVGPQYPNYAKKWHVRIYPHLERPGNDYLGIWRVQVGSNVA